MDVDAIDASRVARACVETTTSTSAASEILATMNDSRGDDESSSGRRARASLARATLTCARNATSVVRERVAALERASAGMGKPPSGTTAREGGDAATTKSVDVACKQGKTTSRLSIADEEEFPALASGARRNLAMALDGTSSETTEAGRPRRVAPTPTTEEMRASASGLGVSRAGANGAMRRIAPTMVSRRVETMDGTGTNASSFASTPAAASGGTVASPASTMKRASASTASTPLTLDRLYVTEPRSVEPMRLPPSLARLAELHAAALRGGFPLDQAPEFAVLLQLLSAPADVVVETSDGDAELCVRTGREARAYACEVLSLAPTLACALGESALETLVESKVVVAHAPTLHAKLVRELGSIRVSSDNCERAYQLEGRLGNTLYGFDLLDALAKASDGGASRSASQSGRVIPISEQQAIEHNRERTRDAFYALLRSSSSRTVSLGQDASVANRARALLANTHPANVRWLADLFVARLSQSSAVGELDEELGKSITPARLSRLHERIVGAGAAPPHPQGGRGGGGARADGRGGRGRGRGAGGRGGGHERIINGSAQNGGFSGDAANAWPSFLCLFPAAQQPFARFIETTDSHKFCVALQRSLVAALHVLDPNASTSTSDARIASANASNAGQTERMLAARAMGSFLGLLTFGFASGSTSSPRSSAGSAPIQGIDLIGSLRRARRRGDLVVSAPWVLAFLRFLPWDSEALETPHYAEALAYLRALASSPNLDPSVVDAEYNVPRMCLRSILANGLAVRAPATLPQAANWNAHSVMPPPPLAAVECLPTTSKEMLVTLGDPLDVALWGADWVPSASANASATANAAEAPDSPSDSDSRIETDVAPDLSRVGVDRRYVEIVCPSVDRALKTMRQTALLARALGEETERSTEPTMKTPSQPANAPRRMQAQAQRIEPTSLSRSASVEFGGAFETKSVVSPTFGVTSPSSAENLLKTTPSMDSKTSSTEIKHALQRAFLQTVPGLRRLVDFAVDAATLAAVDDATAAVTATATASAQPAVTIAARHAAMKYAETATANGASFVPHSGTVIEEAWTPEFERAVERSAMSATRDVIASVARAAADDAGTRAAAAVAALSGASTSRGASASAGSTATTQTACGVAADAAAFAAADRVRRNLPFELHARVASAARRLLKTALVEAKETLSAPREEMTNDDAMKVSKRDAEYASIAASAIASALSAASKWPAGVLLAECASLKTLAERQPDASTLVKGVQNVIECVRKVLDQDAKFSRAQTSRKKPSAHVEKTFPASRPGEALQAKLGQLSRAFVKLLLAAPQNALSKTTKAKTAEEGWGISRDEVCDGLASTLVAVFAASAPALELLSALAPPDARDPWRGVYDDMFASELWLASLREFPESPFAQRRVELVFAAALAKLPRRSAAAESFLHLIDDADKHVGRLGYALAVRGAIRFCAIVAETTTHDEDSVELAAFASSLRDRCDAAGEIRLARRAETAARALRAGTVFAHIKSIAR